MPSLVVDIIDKYHKHPFFTLILALAVAAVGWGCWITFAKADGVAEDVETLKSAMQNVQVDVYNIDLQLQRDKHEQRINDLETEIFQLELLAKNGVIQQEQLERLSILKSELNRKIRELARVPSKKEQPR